MVTNVGSDIINQIGGGSGINTRSLVDQLTELERAPEQRRLDQREQRIDAQISGLGMLRGAMDSMDTMLGILADPDTFDAKQGSISDTSAMAVNKLESKAVPGNYRLEIEQVAQSQSMSSGSFTSTSQPIGEGSLTIRFGNWDDGTFNLDPDAEGATIEIDDSNNTLSGLRDAINRADVGVQASIVGEPGNYRLLLTSPTGATREMEITADEGASPGLSAFNFNEADQAMTQNQAGQDAIMRVNGLQVTRSTNVIDDVIDGMEFELFNAKPGEPVVINITEDRSQAEETIREFVELYNEFVKEIRFLTDRDPGEDPEQGRGSLANDPLANNLLRSLQGVIGSPVAGIENGYNLLSNIGIRTKVDGTLEIVEDGTTGFRAAMDNNFDQVRSLFVPNTESSSSRIAVNNFSNRTQPGSYEVEITQQATRGALEADPATAGFPLDTTGGDFSFTMRVDGRQTETITLPQDRVYESLEELAADFQSLINADENLRGTSARVSVSVVDGALRFESNTYGRDSQVEFRSLGADMADLGITETAGTRGLDVQGTINGVEAFGYGQVLRGAIGSPAEGLSMTVAQGATNATVTFSRGFGSMISTMMDTYSRSSGLISDRETTLRREQDDVSDARERLERRSEAFRARQEAQFRAMEQIVRSLNNTGDFLEGLNDRLPFTAPNRR